MMRMSKQYGKPVRKCSIEELCTSWGTDIPRDRWCSDDECIAYICKLIELGIIDLDDMNNVLLLRELPFRIEQVNVKPRINGKQVKKTLYIVVDKRK